MEELQELLLALAALPPEKPGPEWDLSLRVQLVLAIGAVLREIQLNLN